MADDERSVLVCVKKNSVLSKESRFLSWQKCVPAPAKEMVNVEWACKRRSVKKRQHVKESLKNTEADRGSGNASACPWQMAPSDPVQLRPDLPLSLWSGCWGTPSGDSSHVISGLMLVGSHCCEIDISGWPPSVSNPATLNAVFQNCRKPAQEPWAYSCACDCARRARGGRRGLT
jgi:hypothetical protein